LQRQILYRTDSLGAPKVGAARAALNAVNPEVEVIPIAKRLQGEDLLELVSGADVVLDCSDNFATRHALNRACVKHRKPLVSGAAIRFDAQVAVFDLRKTDAPCYACLYPEDGEIEEVQCSTMGVFAPLVGIIGTMQAAEALKLLAGVGTTLTGRLLMLDGRSMQCSEMRLTRQSQCSVCGTQSAGGSRAD